MMRVKDQTVTHTPGPWCQRADQRFIIAAPWDIHIKPGEPAKHFDDAKKICEVNASPTRVGIEESEANARLIAAAPDLLAALKALYTYTLPASHFFEGAPEFEAGRAAIAKAEGK